MVCLLSSAERVNWLAEKLGRTPGAGAGGVAWVSWVHVGQVGFGAKSVRSVAGGVRGASVRQAPVHRSRRA